jgi:hypothetical protein
MMAYVPSPWWAGRYFVHCEGARKSIATKCSS